MQEMNRRSLLKTAPLAMLAGNKNLFAQNQETNMAAQRGELSEIFDLLDHSLIFHIRQEERNFNVKLPFQKSGGIYGDNSGIPESKFSIFTYWKYNKDHRVSTEMPFHLFPEEEDYIMGKFCKKYDTFTYWGPRYEIPFNFNSSREICDFYEEKLADKRFGRTRQVGISVIENRRIMGSVSIYRKYFLEHRWDVITRNMEILNRKIGGGLSEKKGILSLI